MPFNALVLTVFPHFVPAFIIKRALGERERRLILLSFGLSSNVIHPPDFRRFIMPEIVGLSELRADEMSLAFSAPRDSCLITSHCALVRPDRLSFASNPHFTAFDAFFKSVIVSFINVLLKYFS